MSASNRYDEGTYYCFSDVSTVCAVCLAIADRGGCERVTLFCVSIACQRFFRPVVSISAANADVETSVGLSRTRMLCFHVGHLSIVSKEECD